MPGRLRWPWRAATAALACALAGHAAASSLSGRLVGRDDGRPVDGALVSLVESGMRTRTDAAGRFAFAHVVPGLHTLAVRHVAWASAERTLRVVGNDSLTLALAPAVYRADEVIVRSARTTAPRHASPYATDVVGAGDLGAGPAATVSEALAQVPGLALVRDGAWPTALSIRGLSRASLVTLVDDTRIETAQDLAGALSLVHPDDLERVEIVKSPGSVLFGTGALGGAVHLSTRRARLGERAAWGGEWTTAASSADAGVSHHAAIERSGPRCAARASAGLRAAGDVRTPAGDVPNSSFRERSGSASLALRTGGTTSLVASWQRVQAEDAGIPGGTPIATAARATYRLARRERFALEWTAPNVRTWLPLLTVRAARQAIDREVEIVQSPVVRVTPHATHVLWSSQVEARLRAAPAHLVIAGAEAWQRELDSRRERWFGARDSVVGERPVPRSAHGSVGLYAQDEWDVVRERLRIVAGARVDAGRLRNDRAMNPEWVAVHGEFREPVPGQALLWPDGGRTDLSRSAGVGVHAQLSPALGARALIATAYRAPSLEERYQYLDLGSSLRVGNPGLRPERSLSWGAGLRWRRGGTTLEGDGFVNQLTDLVSEEPGVFEGRPAWIRRNVSAARLLGFELAGSQVLGRRALARGTLAFVRGRDTHRSADLPQIAPLSGTFEVRADVLRGAVTLGTGLAAASAQRHVGPGEAPTPGWTTWNASVESRAIERAGLAWRARAGVRNAFDRAYRQHLSTLRGTVAFEPGRGAWLALTASR